MNKKMASALLAAAPMLAGAAPLTLSVDTGTPTGSGFDLVLDSSNYVAGQVNFGQNNRLDAVQAFVTGGQSGETFTIALYGNNAASRLPDTALDTATAVFGSDGWNGASGLGWALTPGATYWLAIEMSGTDSLGGGAGGLLPVGVPLPLASTAFNAGLRYEVADPNLSFGLQAAASVPEPASLLLVLGAIGLMGLIGKSNAPRRTPLWG